MDQKSRAAFSFVTVLPPRWVECGVRIGRRVAVFLYCYIIRFHLLGTQRGGASELAGPVVPEAAANVFILQRLREGRSTTRRPRRPGAAAAAAAAMS